MSLIDQRKLILKTGFIILILLVAGAYSYFKMRNLILGPSITVNSPENGQTFASSTTMVQGVAKNISFLSLNDRQIFTDDQGNFSEIVALLPGYNILSIKGEDKFGKKTEKIIQLVLGE